MSEEKTLSSKDASPEVRSLVEALHPWPTSNERAYWIVNEHMKDILLCRDGGKVCGARAENERLRAENERLRQEKAGALTAAQGLNVLLNEERAKIEAALAWDLRGETAELTEGEMLDLMVKALKGE